MQTCRYSACLQSTCRYRHACLHVYILWLTPNQPSVQLDNLFSVHTFHCAYISSQQPLCNAELISTSFSNILNSDTVPFTLLLNHILCAKWSYLYLFLPVFCQDRTGTHIQAKVLKWHGMLFWTFEKFYSQCASSSRSSCILVCRWYQVWSCFTHTNI